MDGPRSEPAGKVIVGCVVGALVGIALFSFGVVAFVNQRRLEEQGVTIAARVTDARHMLQIGEGRHESFEVRYAFEVPGQPGTFTATDEFRRADLWATTDGRVEWEEAQATGQVRVRYLAGNPRVNRLATRHGLPLLDCATAIVLAPALLATCLRVGWLEATGEGQHWRAVLALLRKPNRPFSTSRSTGGSGSDFSAWSRSGKARTAIAGERADKRRSLHGSKADKHFSVNCSRRLLALARAAGLG